MSRATLRLPPMRAYDRFFLASSLALARKGLVGNYAFLQLDLAGPLDAVKLRTHLERVVSLQPVLASVVRLTGIFRQPCYSVVPQNNLSSGVSDMLVEADVRDSANPIAEANAIVLAAGRAALEPSRDRPVKLWLIRLGDERHRLLIRWAHHLMDLGGAEALLAEIAGAVAVPRERAPTPRPNLVHRMHAWCRGMWRLRTINFIKANRLKVKDDGRPVTLETSERSWSASQTAAIDAAARAACTPGPMLHTRWQVIALLRAADAVFARSDVHLRETYLISLPKRRAAADNSSGLHRGIAGNLLSIRTLVLSRSNLQCAMACDAELMAQFETYERRGLDLADEMTAAFVGRFPLPVYTYLLEKFRIFPRYSLGFTTMRPRTWDDGFMGCRVDDARAWGVPTSPPGILAAFSRFGDRLGLKVTYFSNACSRGTAEAICDELSVQLGAPPATPSLN